MEVSSSVDAARPCLSACLRDASISTRPSAARRMRALGLLTQKHRCVNVFAREQRLAAGGADALPLRRDERRDAPGLAGLFGTGSDCSGAGLEPGGAAGQSALHRRSRTGPQSQVEVVLRSPLWPDVTCFAAEVLADEVCNPSGQ